MKIRSDIRAGDALSDCQKQTRLLEGTGPPYGANCEGARPTAHADSSNPQAPYVRRRLCWRCVLSRPQRLVRLETAR